MNIILSKEKMGKDKPIDLIIDILLKVSDKDFNDIIENFSNMEKLDNYITYMYDSENLERFKKTKELVVDINNILQNYSISSEFSKQHNDNVLRVPIEIAELLKKSEQLLDRYNKESNEYKRLKSILATRNLDNSIKYLSKKMQIGDVFIKKAFEVLSSDELLEKFYDYDNNIQNFSINNESILIKEYLNFFKKVFGEKDDNGRFLQSSVNQELIKYFHIENLKTMMEKFFKMYDNPKMDRLLYKPELSAGNGDMYKKGDEPDWNVSEELYDSIFNSMPDNLTTEEKAIYIYYKMCQILQYDEGFLYKKRLDKESYHFNFSKEHLENIKPNSKVVCYDFSRIYANLINGLGEGIEGTVIDTGHFSAGFITENASAEVEAINVIYTDGEVKDMDSISNDLMRAKNGLELKGIKPKSDKYGVIRDAIKKISAIVYNGKPLDLSGYIDLLEKAPKEREETADDITLKFEALIETMKENNVYGNEATLTMETVRRSNYFGDEKFNCSYFGEKIVDENGMPRYKRIVIFRPKDKEKSESDKFYVIDTDLLDFSVCGSKEILDRLHTGSLIYEDEKRRLPGLDKEVEK